MIRSIFGLFVLACALCSGYIAGSQHEQRRSFNQSQEMPNSQVFQLRVGNRVATCTVETGGER